MILGADAIVPGYPEAANKSKDWVRMYQTHCGVFKETTGLDAYRVIWDELGAKFCVGAARKAYIAIIEGLDDRMQIFNLLVSYMIDGTISRRRIRTIMSKNDLITRVITDARDELNTILKSRSESN